MEPRRHDSLSTFILLSIALHLLLAGLAPHLKLSAIGSPPHEIEVLLATGREIADIAPPKIQQRPERSRYLGNYDSTVNEEQVAATPPHPTVEAGKKGEPEPIPEPETKSAADRAMVTAIAPDRALSRARRPAR